MVNNESSPDPEVAIRENRAAMPTFSDVASLPTPLRDLQRRTPGPSSGPSPAPHRPSEFTALAIRLRKIRLDESPTADDDSPSQAAGAAAPGKPVRLDFDDCADDAASGKENVENGVARPERARSVRGPKSLEREFGKPIASNTPSRGSAIFHEPKFAIPSLDGVVAPASAEPAASSVEDAIPVVGAVISIVNDAVTAACGTPPSDNDTATTIVDPQAIASTAENNIPVVGTEPEYASSSNTEDARDAVSTVAVPSESSVPSVEDSVPSTAAEPESELSLSEDVGAPVAVTQTVAEPESPQSEALATVAPMDMEMSDVGSTSSGTEATEESEPAADVASDANQPTISADASNSGIVVHTQNVPHLEENDDVASAVERAVTNTAGHSNVKDDLAVKDGNSSPSGSSWDLNQTKDVPTIQPTTDGAGSSGAITGSLQEPLQKLLEGKDKWSWPKRCEAMAAVGKQLSSSSENTRSEVRNVLPQLAGAINSNLDELRPSVMTSALSLVNCIVCSKVDEESRFAEEVFPSIMDLACGRSLTAQEAAKSVSILLSFHPDLATILEDADNPDRLCELLKLESNASGTDDESRARANTALKLVRSAVFKDALDQPQPLPTTAGPTTQVTKLSADIPSNVPLASQESRRQAESPPTAKVSRTPVQRSENVRLSTSREGTFATPSGAVKTAGTKRASVRIDRLPGSGLKTTPRSSVRGRSESRMSTPLVRNMKLGDSIRKLSPGSSRKRRVYSEEEMEEARRAAMRVVMEEASQAHEKERERYQKEKEDTEKRLRSEQSLVIELKAVLEEYQLTMQNMVSQGNSQASAYSTSLENETKKLKADLLETTEAYESLKERYVTTKQTMVLYENKETRSIEQIKELKRNMAELQKWSNDLKANTEKKLSKAFESVTTYRASYMDKEAHLSKANSDLVRVKTELAEEIAKHSETAAAVSRTEAQLHNEQDIRSSVEAAMSTTKESLARLTSLKDRLQKNLNIAQEELKASKTELAKMRDADTRAVEAAKQLESFSVESQALKARAYDDMTRIRSLERELESKEKDYEELSTICEEALSQLEKVKADGK